MSLSNDRFLLVQIIFSTNVINFKPPSAFLGRWRQSRAPTSTRVVPQLRTLFLRSHTRGLARRCAAPRLWRASATRSGFLALVKSLASSRCGTMKIVVSISLASTQFAVWAFLQANNAVRSTSAAVLWFKACNDLVVRNIRFRVSMESGQTYGQTPAIRVRIRI